MPLNASFRLFSPLTPCLAARFRAAQKPLRIPKVIEKAVFYRAGHGLETLFIYYFIDVLRHYPG